jgi:predicted enzyme related to lactoylglutathione lyase
VRELVDAGGTRLRRVDEHGGWWVVMADPEGNEFCVT